MSFSRGNTDELLSQGMAAAQSGDPRDHDEAQYYLEWVLRTDSDLDQQALAWYWLSRIAPDPARRRECLENVLAIQPTNPDARRDLAIVDGRLKQDALRSNALKEGTPVPQEPTIPAGEVKRFRCPTCGANTSFDPNVGMVRCQFCGTQINEQGEAVDAPSPGLGAVSEQDWVAAIYTEQGHRWALPENRVLECQGCGASITFAPSRVSTTCLYCGSPYVVRTSGPDTHDLRHPDGIVPFACDEATATAHAQQWLAERAGKGGVPRELASLAAMQSPSPIYLPFWTFDIGGDVEWSGWTRPDIDTGGIGLNDMDNAARLGGMALGLVTGNTGMAARGAAGMAAKHFDKSNMVHTQGAVPVILDDVPVPGTTSLPAPLLEGLRYRTEDAVPYSDDMLAACPAEVYSVSLSDASLVARERAVKEGDDQIAFHTGHSVTSSMQVNRSGLAVMSYKLLLLPIWTLSYTYRGNVYRVVVNGQSGEVEGETPRDSNPVSRFFGV